MKQYVRAYIRGGEIVHLHTQATPITHEPVEDASIEATDDFEIEVEADGLRRGELALDAASLRERLEVGPDNRVRPRPAEPQIPIQRKIRAKAT